jgi:SAM-dependent methyltransferase
MNENEYRLMADIESDHWWYRGLRDLLGRVIASAGMIGRSDLNVLDAGCGTGANLRLLKESLQPSYLGGFDVSPLALELCREKLADADLYRSDVCDPEVHADAYDLIVSCDVLSAVGLPAAREGLRRLAGRLRPGGLLVLNLPAYEWLYSEHDVAVGTCARFGARQVGRFLGEIGLERWLLSYRLCALFPAVLAGRLPSMLKKPRRDLARSDLSRPPAFVNRALAAVLRAENAAIIRGVRLPWGSSVFAVGRRN